MEKTLDILCDVLDDELERQETVLAVCRKKQAAIRAMDIAALEVRTEALESIVRETINAEHDRHKVLRDVVDALGLPAEKHTLSELINAIDEPWKGRLRLIQQRLRDTIMETRRVTRAYSRDLRRYRKLSTDRMQSLGFPHNDALAGGYNASGNAPLSRGASPAMVNQKG